MQPQAHPASSSSSGRIDATSRSDTLYWAWMDTLWTLEERGYREDADAIRRRWRDVL